MFKVNNKYTRTSPPCSSVSIVNFEQVNAGWDSIANFQWQVLNINIMKSKGVILFQEVLQMMKFDHYRSLCGFFLVTD